MKKEPVRLAWAAKVVVALSAWLGLRLPPEAVLGVMVAAEPLVSELVRHFVTPESKAQHRELVAAHRGESPPRVTQ